MTFHKPRPASIVYAASLFLIAAGTLIVCAWFQSWRTVLRVLPGAPFTSVDAALGFSLAGIAFFAMAKRKRRLAILLGSCLLALGCLLLATFFGTTGFSLHHFLQKVTASVASPAIAHTIRLAPATAVVFSLLGILVLIFAADQPKHRASNTAAFLISLIFSIGLLDLLVYWGGIVDSGLIGLGAWTGFLIKTSIPAAICACACGCGAAGLFWMKYEHQHRPFPPSAVTLTLLGFLLLFAGLDGAIVRNARLALSTRVLVDSTTRQISLFEAAVASVRRAELNQRSYLLTGRKEYLDNYSQNLQEAGINLSDLRSFADATHMSADLRRLIGNKLDELSLTLKLANNRRREDAVALISSGGGLNLMKQIEAESAVRVENLRTDLARALDGNQQSLLLMQRIVKISLALSILLIGLGLAVLGLEMRRQSSVEAELRVNSANLERKVAERTAAIAEQAQALQLEVERRRLTEVRLRETDDRLRTALNSAKALFWTWNMSADEISWSGPVGDVFGHDAASLSTYKDFRKIVVPEDRQNIDLQVSKKASVKPEVYSEYRVVDSKGKERWIGAFWGSMTDSEGKLNGYAGVNLEISDKKLAALRIQESERQLRELADAMPHIILRAGADGQLDYCNARWSEYTGFTLEQTKLFGWWSAIHPEDASKCREIADRGLVTGAPFEAEFRLRRALDGEYRWHLGRSVPFRDQKGGILRWFASSTDIHEQKMAEQLLEVEVLNRTRALEQLQAKEEALSRSLAEKSTLLKEVHHRVKNNLQIICSLLRMQSELLSDQTIASALVESHQRVLCMALIHERLYNNDNQMESINFEDYTRKLVTDLVDSYGGSGVSCRFETASVFLKIDQAIPCGLIINELVTNALKYAYPKGENGEVTIHLTETIKGRVVLGIFDKGVGLPVDLNLQTTKSMGLPIVDLLSLQLGGTLTVESNHGARFTLEFPNEVHSQSAAFVYAS